MNHAFDSALAEKLEGCGVAAVLIIDDAAHAVPLAKALLDGGISVMELTLRTPAALPALKEIRAAVPEMMAGAGTVLTPGQVQEVKDAGAAFAVSPGVNPRVLTAAKSCGLSFAPGIATPTDIELALEHNCRLLKFFPAEPMGGLKYLAGMSAPYAHLGLKYVPLGGLNASNMPAWLADPQIAAIGGSWIAPRPLIQKQDWAAITALAAEAAALVKQRQKN